MMRSALVVFSAFLCSCGSDSSDPDDGASGASGGSTASGGSGGSAGSAAIEPECECAGQCLTSEQIATTYCVDTTTLRYPSGPDCNGLRFTVQGEDYSITFHYGPSGELLATERSEAGEPGCESGQIPDLCMDTARFEAERCAVCAAASFGNPGNLPECQ